MSAAAGAAGARWQVRRRLRARLFLGFYGAAAGAVFVASLCMGPVALEPGEVFSALAAAAGVGAAAGDDFARSVVMAIRLPRAIAAALVGACLAVAGACLQGLFRNPLADPGLVGVSSGAALAAVSVIVFGGPLLSVLPQGALLYALPAASFLGGLAATLVVYRVASPDGRTDVAIMLLAGIAVAAIAQAAIGFMIFASDDEQLRTLNFWLLGGLGGVTWAMLLPAAPLLVAAPLVALRLAGALNAMLLGEREARHLGFEIEGLKRLAVVVAAVGTGAAVSISGVIVFVGLVVPHLVRLMTGPDHRTLLPGSALLGAALLPAADLVARTVVVPADLPIGIVTGLAGGPFFLVLLMRARRRLGL